MADASAARSRSWWGWGWADQAIGDEECAQLGAGLPGLRERPRPIPRAEDLDLRRPRVDPPASLARLCSDDPADRAAHTHGQAYRDVVRNLRLDLEHPPDWVVRPEAEQDVVDVLDWAADARVAVVPYGGGSSVVGGVEYRGDEHPAGVSLDLTAMGGVREIDLVSQAARIQAGALGPALEDQLREHGLTLRHFPQSFEFSTLGGWLATRAGGHFATVETHIDDLVESIRAVTPSGVTESFRLPGSGAGPSPDRMLLGSEGTLGVITEAWMRVRPRPGPASLGQRALRRRAPCPGRHPCHRPIRATAVELPPAGPGRGRVQRRRRRQPQRAGAGVRVQRRAGGRSAGPRAGADHRARRAVAGARGPGPATATAPRAPGATRSCGCPTCATRSRAWAG